nr:MAG TPA: hypothetical protein [Caudoviricetes sp.]
MQFQNKKVRKNNIIILNVKFITCTFVLNY